MQQGYILVLLGAFVTSSIASSQRDLNRQGSVFDVVYSQLRGKGAEFAEFILELTENDEILDDLYEFADILDEEEEVDSTNRTTCVLCRAAMATMKTFVANYEWEELRDPVVQACYFLFENLTDTYVNTDVLCPGTIDTQGPHVYEILRPVYRKGPEEICLNLNACFPPPEEPEITDDIPTNSKKSSAYNLGENGPEKSLAERKANALKVIQMTDIHIEPLYKEDTLVECGLYVCCIERYGEGTAGYYGDYECNIPPRTMELFFQKAAELEPTFVMFSGDAPPHKIWDETYDSQLNCTKILVDTATRYLGETRVFPNIGNHEMYPTNLFSLQFLEPYTQDMANAFAESWTDLADFGPEQEETMRNGGYYSIEALPGLRVISFNTNYWYTMNWYNTLNIGEAEVENMRAFLLDSMDAARSNNEKVILIAHHPPGKSDCIIQYSRDFERLVANYSDLIVLQAAGHTHSDHYKVLSDEDGNAIAMTYINPTAGAKTRHNPSMRMYYLDAETYEVIDFEQYGFNLLEAAGSTEPPSIDLIYSAMQEYQLSDMSPASWKSLTLRMAEDNDLFNRYYYNYGSQHSINNTCTDACKAEQLCSNSYYSFDEYVYCVEDWEAANNVTAVLL